jgi:predicted transcriptional regulator of viral defense system
MALKTSEYLTPEEVAAILRVSTETVMRKFARRQGVLDLGSPERMHKRRYRVLRIPRETLESYILEVGAKK